PRLAGPGPLPSWPEARAPGFARSRRAQAHEAAGRGPEGWNRGTRGALVRRMTLRTLLALSLLASSSALAQPAPKQPPSRPAPRPAPPPRTSAAADDMAAFEHDLDTLFAPGGLTSDQAAARAGGASPTVRRRAAEIEAAIAQQEAAE